jgi:tetratricopeptide (TPR) repeat protein
MINLPPELVPSELLCCEELPTFIDKLLQNSRELRQRGKLSEAQRCVLDVIEALQEPATVVGQAMALIHLADVRRQMGKLGTALADSQKAYPVFQRQPSQYQRHNEAVAAYAMGLIHQLLGSELEALRWYQISNQLFEKVRQHWATINALSRVEECTRLHSWIKTLTEYLTVPETRNRNPSAWVRVPVIISNAGEDKFVVMDLQIDHYSICEREARAGTFGVRPPKGKEAVSLEPNTECSTQKILDEALLESMGATQEDYALIAWKNLDKKEEADVVESLDDSEAYGPFVRDPDGTIHFVRPTPILIGEEETDRNLQIGNIIALLSPAPPSSGPAPPSSPEPSTPPPPGPSTPSPDPSAEAAALYDKLVGTARGDRAAADRLIELERKRDPDAS